MSFLFILFSTFILIAILYSFFDLVMRHRKFNSEYKSTVSYGRIVNFKTGKSKIQYGVS